MNSDRSNNFSLKYLRFKPSCYEDKGLKKFEFVGKKLSFFVNILQYIRQLSQDQAFSILVV